MSCPSKGDMAGLEKIGRYLLGRMRVVYTFEWQATPGGITCYTDANWAGCSTTRKSTSAGAIQYGSHLIKTWSKTQATVALSSGEAELHGIVKATAESIGLHNLLRELCNLKTKQSIC